MVGGTWGRFGEDTHSVHSVLAIYHPSTDLQSSVVNVCSLLFNLPLLKDVMRVLLDFHNMSQINS